MWLSIEIVECEQRAVELDPGRLDQGRGRQRLASRGRHQHAGAGVKDLG